jgi:hypothetical protein
MKKLQFWWNYITNPAFRHYVHLHDVQAFQDDIKRRIEEKALYESRMIYQQKYPNNN